VVRGSALCVCWGGGRQEDAFPFLSHISVMLYIAPEFEEPSITEQEGIFQCAELLTMLSYCRRARDIVVIEALGYKLEGCGFETRGGGGFFKFTQSFQPH
jgi:hypothetical protein